jgi:hypothetical protein
MKSIRKTIFPLLLLGVLSACTRTMKAPPAGPPTANLTLWSTQTASPVPSATDLPPAIQSATALFASIATAGTSAPGQDADRPPTATDAPCRLETYSDVTIRDGTKFQPGEVFLKIWRFENMGTCQFNADEYYLIFDGGERLGGPVLAPVLFYPRRTNLQLNLGGSAWEQRAEIIDEDQMVDVPILLQAPDQPGRYRGYWKLIHAENGQTLEDDFWVEIQVDEADDQSAQSWSGAWLNSDPGRSDKFASPLSLYQIKNQVRGFTYSSDGKLYLIEGQVSEDGQTVDGFFGQPWDEGLPFQWVLRENQDQFQGHFWLGESVAGEWCGARAGQPLPEKCSLD